MTASKAASLYTSDCVWKNWSSGRCGLLEAGNLGLLPTGQQHQVCRRGRRAGCFNRRTGLVTGRGNARDAPAVGVEVDAVDATAAAAVETPAVTCWGDVTPPRAG